jgi:hypothetical protein
MAASQATRARVVGKQIGAALVRNWPLLLIVGLGVALRLWMIWVSPLDPRFSTADDGDYYRRALRLAVTGQYVDDSWLIRPPLHVFFFAFWLRLALLIGRPALGILLIELAQTAISALTIGLGYASARRLFSSQAAGLFFAAFLSFWFSFVEQPTVLFSELLYLFLFLLHFWLLLRFDASGRKRDLALSGMALGAAALTRSPALYSIAFVVLWLFVRQSVQGTRQLEPRDHRHLQASFLQPAIYNLQSAIAPIAVVTICCLAVVLPWTARNYLLYHHIIPVDTLGQINLWLDLDKVDQREVHINTLRQMPQADRAPYALARAREILAADPLRPLHPMWDTFQHIWKAQYIEDYFVKRSFFTRPLRATAPLGLAGDAIWLAYTLAGLIGLARPAREGLHNRLFVLAWLGYSFLTVLIFHVEPRYLLPIWMLIGLYGAWVLAGIRWPGRNRPGDRATGRQGDGRSPGPVVSLSTTLSQGWLYTLAQVLLVLGFLALLLSYRDYPAIIASGIARERGMIAGERAYAAGNYAAAEQSFRAALAAQPDFIDGQLDLALALAAQGRRGEARALLNAGDSRRTDLVIGALARDSGDLEAARGPLGRAEDRAGEDIQTWALEWLRPPPTNALQLSEGLDLGYIAGFSGGESDGTGTFRWLAGDGRVALPLAKPLAASSTLLLRMTSGRPGAVPLGIWIGGRWAGQVAVAPGQWRVYQLPVPPELAGQSKIDIRLSAPTFVPARETPGSDDARMLSLMISQVRVQ